MKDLKKFAPSKHTGRCGAAVGNKGIQKVGTRESDWRRGDSITAITPRLLAPHHKLLLDICIPPARAADRAKKRTAWIVVAAAAAVTCSSNRSLFTLGAAEIVTEFRPAAELS